jgi:general secretion pathway protein L
MSTLIIALPLSGGDTTTRYEHVLTPDGQSIALHATSTANLLPDASRGADETVAVVPAEALSWHRVELPKGVGAGSPRLRPVLQSLLEDRLLDDPQDLHLACEPSPAADRPIWIAACDKAWLSQHLQQLEAARRPVTRIVPEFAPHAEALRIQAIGEDDHAQMLVSGGVVAGGVVRLPLNASILAVIVGPEGLPEQSELLAEPAVAALTEERLQRPVEIQQRTQRFLSAIRTPWDLAQFDLTNTSRTRTLKRLLGAGQTLLHAPQWRAARWGALLLLAANLIGLNVWAWKEQASWQSRRSAIDSTLTRTFPAVKVVVDAPLQMAREVAALRQATGAPSGSDLEVVLTAVGTALPQGKTPTAIDYAGGEVRLKGLNLDPDEMTAMTAVLRTMGYSGRMDGDSLQIRMEGNR